MIGGMHAGLIPIVSYESGVDVDDFGVELSRSSVDDIKSAVRRIAGLSGSGLQGMARRAWESARAHHTRDRWTHVYRNAIETILDLHREQGRIGESSRLPRTFPVQ